MHSKFAVRPQHVWKYGRHPTAEIRRGKKKTEERRKIETTGQKLKNIMVCPIT